MRELMHFAREHWILVLARAIIQPTFAVVMDITLNDSGVKSWTLNVLDVLLFILSAVIVRLARKYHVDILTIPGMRRLAAVKFSGRSASG